MDIVVLKLWYLADFSDIERIRITLYGISFINEVQISRPFCNEKGRLNCNMTPVNYITRNEKDKRTML